VTYEDPVPALESQLTAAQGGAAAASAELSTTRNELNATKARLDLAEEELVVVQLEAARTHNNVVNTTATVEALAGQVLTLSVVATAALLGALGAIGLLVVTAGRMREDGESAKGKQGD
jgi:transcription elongation GreA/GreB family factor